MRSHGWVFIILFQLLSFSVYAKEKIRILGVSSSGKTIVINKGTLEKYGLGDYGFFYFQNDLDTSLEKVAKAILVDAKSNKSYWYLKEVYNPNYINRDGGLVLYSKSRYDSGRREFKIRSNKVFLQKNTKSDVYIEDSKIGAPKSHRLLEDSYEGRNEELTATVNGREDVDIISTEFHKFLQKQGNQKKIKSAKSKERYVENVALRAVYEDEYYQSYLDGLEEKFNSLKNGHNELYNRDLDKTDIADSVELLTINNSYRDALEQRKKKVHFNRRAVKKMTNEGDFWSADMDDGELRKFIVNSGILEEQKRKEYALTNAAGHEVFLRYGWGTQQNTTTEDDSFQGPGYSLAIGYELHLNRIHRNFKRWSTDLGMEFANNYFDPGTEFNVKSVESLFFGRVNFYFWNYPTTLNRFVWFIGMGMKAGNAKLESINLSKDYDYQARSFSTLQAGLKYRIGAGDRPDEKMGIGLSFTGLYESVNYSSDEENVDDIDGNITVNDLKLSLGMSVYF